MWIKHPFFKYITGALLTVIFIFFLGKIDFFLAPFQKLVAILFFPILIAGLLYYILRPVVNLFSRPKYIPRPVAIFLVFILIAAIIFATSHFVGDFVAQQVSQMVKEIPKKVEEAVEETKQLINENNLGMFSVEEIKQKALAYLGNISQTIGHNLAGIAKAITSGYSFCDRSVYFVLLFKG